MGGSPGRTLAYIVIAIICLGLALILFPPLRNIISDTSFIDTSSFPEHTALAVKLLPWSFLAIVLFYVFWKARGKD